MGKAHSRRSFKEDLQAFEKSQIVTFRSFEEADEFDREYWLSRSPVERMIALEQIRQLAWGYNEQSEPQLSRSPHLLKLRRRSLSGSRRVRGMKRAKKERRE